MSNMCPQCGQPLPPFDGAALTAGRCRTCGHLDAGTDKNVETSLKSNNDNTNDAPRFEYHLKESEATAASPLELVQPLSLLQKHLNTESEQIQKKRIIAGTIAGGILVSVILLRIAGELFKEYTRQKKEGEKVQQVEWSNGKKRAGEKLVRPAVERKDANEPDDERQEELASMH